VVFDGDAAAVRVNEWGPLLMLSLLALLVALLGTGRAAALSHPENGRRPIH
jgi:hypothetical protein